jgi:hypothetical protein
MASVSVDPKEASVPPSPHILSHLDLAPFGTRVAVPDVGTKQEAHVSVNLGTLVSVIMWRPGLVFQ